MARIHTRFMVLHACCQEKQQQQQPQRRPQRHQQQKHQQRHEEHQPPPPPQPATTTSESTNIATQTSSSNSNNKLGLALLISAVREVSLARRDLGWGVDAMAMRLTMLGILRHARKKPGAAAIPEEVCWHSRAPRACVLSLRGGFLGSKRMNGNTPGEKDRKIQRKD